MNESRNFNDREFEKMLVWKVTSLNMDIDVLEDENTRLQYEIDKYKKEILMCRNFYSVSFVQEIKDM